ncbi:heme o synthase [Candidatus Saccharibacteria bacterium]|nr:heme o synthase [Candidatus Saccharibacteria bacterium]
MEILKTYYRLTKPGIVYGNLITAAAGFLLACSQEIFWKLLVETLIGIGLVIAAACVFNNYLDKQIDAKMARTRNRAIPAGKISPIAALAYASILTVGGFTDLAVFTNWYVVGLGFIALYFYVVIYGISKRRTVHGTLVGSIPGATPPAAGYLAVTNHIDAAAILLFLAIVFWQMPHFYAIAMYRYKDYKAAGLPVLTVAKGMMAARRQIILYVIGFGATVVLLSIIGPAGYLYLVGGVVLTLFWLYRGLYKVSSLNDERWGRRMFLTSLIVSLGWSVLTALGGRLP